MKSSAAHYSARKHKWESEMTWLAHDQAVQGYWQNEEHVIEESKSIQRELISAKVVMLRMIMH